MTAQRPTASRDYCRGCGTSTLHPFAGWVTDDGSENTIRPRAFYRTCALCSLLVMTLADVTDAEGLARIALDEHLRVHGGAATATAKPVGPPPLDWDACLNFLFQTLWQLYAEKWSPAHGVMFRSYGLGLIRKRRDGWIRDETGDASERTKGRVHPKAHAQSVSVSYDELQERFAGHDADDASGFERVYAVVERADDLSAVAALVSGRSGDVADDRSPDLAWALTTRGSV